MSLANFHLLQAGTSGVFNGTETEVPITGFQLLDDDTQAQLSTAPLAHGIYEIRIVEDGITDRALNPLGSGVVSSDFTLQVQLIQNGGFETGDFTGWTITPTLGGSANVVSSWTAIPNDGATYAPEDGSHFAVLQNGLSNVYEMVFQQFTVQPADTISGWAFFDTSDHLPYTDNGYVYVTDANNNIVATPFAASIASGGGYGETRWTLWQYTFTAGGVYKIAAGVDNGIDSAVASSIGLDAV